MTDELGRVVLMLDDGRKITGTGEYDVYGNVNTATTSAETAHPYAPNLNLNLLTMSQPVVGGDGGVQLTVSMRAHLFWLDAQWTGGFPYTPLDYLQLVNATTDAGMSMLYSGPQFIQPFWTDWVQPDAGSSVHVRFVSVPTGGGRNGATIDAWEYRKNQVGSTAFWTPLRLPGQYYDEESAFFENHNRYYAPDLGRYLQPDPVTSVAAANEATYAYAGSNPVAYIDADGRFKAPTTPCKYWAEGVKRARQKAGCMATAEGEMCGVSNNRCQKKLKDCQACDICKLLDDSYATPTFAVADLQCAGKPSWGCSGVTTAGKGQLDFDRRFCDDPALLDKFANTLIHESAHHCKAIGGGNITEGGGECSAKSIADECTK